MNQNKIKNITDFIFNFFKDYKVGQGLFFNTIRFKAEEQYKNNRLQLSELYIVFNSLLGNGYLEISEESKQFVRLTQRGFDYLYGDEVLMPFVSLNDALYSKNRKQEEVYNELWNYIGKENDALFYVKGSVFYDTIKTYLITLPPNYGLYIESLKKQGKSTSRVSWYRELFLSLNTNDVTSFLDKLSDAINLEIQQGTPELEVITDISENAPVSSETPDKDLTLMSVASNVEKVPHVFISYAWEEKHDDWVLKLSNNLRAKGINCQIDKYQPYGTDLVKFMRDEIRNSDKVLVLLTPQYKKKAESGRGGASYEGSIMSHAIYNEQSTTKFIPLLREGLFELSCPDFISGRKGFDFTDDNLYENEFITLVKVLKGEPVIDIPDLGK